MGHFGFRINDLSVDGEYSYERGRDIVFFQRTDCSNNCIVSVGNKFKTRVTVVQYNITDSQHLKIKQFAHYMLVDTTATVLDHLKFGIL